VTLFTGLDMAIVIAMVWFGLETTGSTFLVGATLCVATVVPYLCEQFIGRFVTVELSMRRLLYIRLTAFGAVLGLSLTDAALLPIGFLSIAFVVGVTDYFTISTLESKNTKLVLAGVTNSDTSARLMQTSIQIGAFGGALLGGMIVDVFSVNQTLQIISLAAIVSQGAMLLVAATPTSDDPVQTPQTSSTPTRALPANLYILIIVLSMIGFHIGAFNSLVPIVFQKLNEWNATLFGVASGLAGLGAFSAAVLPRIKLNSYSAILLVVLADVAIVYLQNLYVMMAAAFLLGFCINSSRTAYTKGSLGSSGSWAMKIPSAPTRNCSGDSFQRAPSPSITSSTLITPLRFAMVSASACTPTIIGRTSTYRARKSPGSFSRCLPRKTSPSPPVT
jgi:hypothetical protein